MTPVKRSGSDTGSGSRVLVTSGPTRAYIDRIRYIANTSTGELGARIVESLIARKIPVVHLFGAESELPAVEDESLHETVGIVTFDDLLNAVDGISERDDIGAVVHAMAVLDYTPVSPSLDVKRKSLDTYWNISLVQSPKITPILRAGLPDAYFIGFKLEAGVNENELVMRATQSLEKYGLDAVVANDLNDVSSGRHRALVIGPENKILARCDTKADIARAIADLIEKAFSADSIDK